MCRCLVTITLDANSKAVSINPIPDQIRRLQIIKCDICKMSTASYDVFVDGIIDKVVVLKRCCNECVKLFSQS